MCVCVGMYARTDVTRICVHTRKQERAHAIDCKMEGMAGGRQAGRRGGGVGGAYVRESEPLREDIEAGLALERLSTGLPVRESPPTPPHAGLPVGVRLPPPPKMLGTKSPKSVS